MHGAIPHTLHGKGSKENRQSRTDKRKNIGKRESLLVASKRQLVLEDHHTDHVQK